ncbi:hypothetical protein PTSG_06241 [Salpingoeca rosetta]|uniref:Arylesterase n=1 Tax=Salpingoeca rosetta (strain ATCC 50818 / BSB-021) TaxID=946362 RepID=F2UCC4_SALR5|nr:uncharacterized protein PTSG_06241 [Salpingoeca rosetta]EGD74231.1 hypothetical protein PTSG_06241 [Salpingoeca rosetta]|eukprot:XP_004993131.1 hypothetical protein PTSG_06241 [Salpingoeca rosetta]
MFAAVAAIVVAIVGWRLHDMGEFKLLKDHGVVNPRHVTGFIGVEDLQLVNGTLFGSTEDRSWLRLMLPTSVPVDQRLTEMPDGALLRLDPAFLEAVKNGKVTQFSEDNKMVLEGFSGRFHPHGIFVHELTRDEAAAYPDSPAFLVAAINNKPGERGVELFTWKDTTSNTLKHIGTIAHPLFRWLNDITLVSAGEMYATNWLYETPGTFPSLIESLAKKPVNYVLQCTFNPTTAGNVDCKIVVDKQRMPNGIQFLRASNEIAVVESLAHTITVYSRHDADGSLSVKRVFDTDSACDNLVPLHDGRLLSGCHPKQLTFGFHSAFHTSAPTQVLLLDPSKDADDAAAVQELLLTTTANYSAASVAVPTDTGLLVLGSVNEDGLLVTDAPSNIL